MSKDVPFVVAPIPSEDPKKKEGPQEDDKEKPQTNGVHGVAKGGKQDKVEELVRTALPRALPPMPLLCRSYSLKRMLRSRQSWRCS